MKIACLSLSLLLCASVNCYVLSNFNDTDHLLHNEIGENVRIDDLRLANWYLIYPGTKWCGPGDSASSFYDLGDLEATDKCCRSHDLCNDYIEAYETRHNLTNKKPYTTLNCNCDDQFLKCLKSVNKQESLIIGRIYFNLIGQQCFQNEYPITKCLKYRYFPIKKCLFYELDTTREKYYQWFDVPVF